MPRSRGSDIPPKQSPRGPSSLKTSSSDSDQMHYRPIADRSPKLGNRCSPRSTQSDPLNRKKLGTRITDLESQLGQAQEELKTLKEQLASAEAARRQAQEKLEKKDSGRTIPEPEKIQEKNRSTTVQASPANDDVAPQDYADDNQRETDVFEVPAEKVTVANNKPSGEFEKETKPVDLWNPPTIIEPEKLYLQVSESRNEEINMLKLELEDKEKELELIGKDNENLKNQLDEAVSKFSSAQTKEQEMASNLKQLEEELKTSKINAAELTEKFQHMEGAKEALEAEMKKLRVQTEQWRKAADAAAAVIAGDADMNGRISERCGSMDKHFGNMFVPSTTGYAGFVGSPGITDDLDDGFGGGKRKGSGVRMFSELWKKRGQK